MSFYTSLADYLVGKVSREEIQELSRLKKKFWSRAAARKKHLVKPVPSPRYDDVFREGLRVMEEDKSES